MTTLATTDGNGDGLWLSVRALARLKGVDQAVISRRVARMVDEQLIVTRPGPRGAKLINRAEYDRLTGATGDPAKQQAADTARLFRDDAAAADPPPQNPSAQRASDAKRDQAVYDAELRKLTLAERRKQVLAISAVVAARDRCAAEMLDAFEHAELRAAEVAAAVNRDGEAGARAILQRIVFDLRAAVTHALRRLEEIGLAEEAAGPIAAEIDLDADTEALVA